MVIKIIIELIFDLIFGLVDGLIGLIPQGLSLPLWSAKAFKLVGFGLSFFPKDAFVIIIGNITFWTLAQMAWAVIEWVYKKIPGVS